MAKNPEEEHGYIPELPNGIHTPGILVHGIDRVYDNYLEKILKEGLVPLDYQINPVKKDRMFSVNSDFVSFSFIGKDGYNASSAHIWHGPDAKYRPYSAAIIVNPVYVETHSDNFIGVGEAFDHMKVINRLYGFLDIKRAFNVDPRLRGNVFVDEVFATYVAPEGILGFFTLPAEVQRLRQKVLTLSIDRSFKLKIYDTDNNYHGEI